jgi:hypothetical protein
MASSQYVIVVSQGLSNGCSSNVRFTTILAWAVDLSTFSAGAARKFRKMNREARATADPSVRLTVRPPDMMSDYVPSFDIVRREHSKDALRRRPHLSSGHDGADTIGHR